MDTKLNPTAMAGAGAIVSAAIMLILGILGNLGLYTGAVEMMRRWHMFFTLSPGGIAAGMAEAAILSFIIIWPFAWIYNRLA